MNIMGMSSKTHVIITLWSNNMWTPKRAQSSLFGKGTRQQTKTYARNNYASDEYTTNSRACGLQWSNGALHSKLVGVKSAWPDRKCGVRTPLPLTYGEPVAIIPKMWPRPPPPPAKKKRNGCLVVLLLVLLSLLALLQEPCNNQWGRPNPPKSFDGWPCRPPNYQISYGA